MHMLCWSQRRTMENVVSPCLEKNRTLCWDSSLFYNMNIVFMLSFDNKGTYFSYFKTEDVSVPQHSLTGIPKSKLCVYLLTMKVKHH